MLRAAQRLSERLLPLVLQGLERLEAGDSMRSRSVGHFLNMDWGRGHSSGGLRSRLRMCGVRGSTTRCNWDMDILRYWMGACITMLILVEPNINGFGRCSSGTCGNGIWIKWALTLGAASENMRSSGRF